MTSTPVNECEAPRQLAVILTDAGGHNIGDGTIAVNGECSQCDPRKPVQLAEITVQVNRDCGCITTIGIYTREAR
jgi:hypothetical protein